MSHLHTASQAKSLTLDPAKGLRCTENVKAVHMVQDRLSGLLSTPSLPHMRQTLVALKTSYSALLHTLGACDWFEMRTADNTSVYWDVLLRNAITALYDATAPHATSSGWRIDAATQAVASLRDAFANVSSASADFPVRWVVRQMEQAPPFYGTVIVVPTTMPLMGEQMFRSRETAEYAMYRNSPSTTIYTYNTLSTPVGVMQEMRRGVMGAVAIARRMK
jgi:hypothetical protein